MTTTVRRTGWAFTAAFAALASSALIAPAVGSAAGCGPGTVYDAPTDMCVAAPAPAAPAPAAWDAPPPPAPAPPPSVLPPGMPPVQICPPIPFVAVCFPVN